mgnify:CR=1 FL=1
MRAVLALLSIAATVAAPAGAGGSAHLERLLERIAATAGAPGAVLVAGNGASVRSVAIGSEDREGGAPLRPGARFRIASVSKTFLAATVLRLVGEGRLELDEPVSRWLPTELGLGRATVRQLLNHTSGLYDGGPLEPAPGPFVYANENYEVLGRLVRAVTGQSPWQAIASRIVRPLRLAGTSWPLTARPPGLARGSAPHGNDVTARMPRVLTPADALVSTAHDLRRFLVALLGGRLIRPRELAAMKTAVDVGPAYRLVDERYGLGLMGFDTPCGPVWGHRGRIAGYTVFAFATPDTARSAVVALNVGRIGDATVARLNPLVFAALCS